MSSLPTNILLGGMFAVTVLQGFQLGELANLFNDTNDHRILTCALPDPENTTVIADAVSQCERTADILANLPETIGHKVVIHYSTGANPTMSP